MAKLEGKVVVAQGGGPTAVINQSLVGVVIEARKFPQVTRVYGAINGVQGIIEERFIDLTQETTNNLERVANTPASALLSTRVKPDEEYFDLFVASHIHCPGRHNALGTVQRGKGLRKLVHMPANRGQSVYQDHLVARTGDI